MRRLLPLIFLATSCGALKDSPKYQLSTGSYLFKSKGEKYRKTYVQWEDDSLSVYELPGQQKVYLISGEVKYFLTRSFDIDVMTVPFKFRPATQNLPVQLNTDFNGNVFIGYRFDRFKLKYKPSIARLDRMYSHRGLTAGVFGGIGGTNLSPSTTNNRMNDEYTGLVLTRGLAFMVGVNTLTVGLGIGFDYLTDRDKDIWIYQTRPWYGLTIGLNLN